LVVIQCISQLSWKSGTKLGAICNSKFVYNIFEFRWGVTRDYGVGRLGFGGSCDDKYYSAGKNLASGTDVLNIVKRAISRECLPPDYANGIFMVLTAK
jgi:hypothetical protein